MIKSLPKTTKLIINADDPALSYLGSLHQNVQFFGLELTDYGSETLPHAADSLHCQKCDSRQFNTHVVGVIGGDTGCAQTLQENGFQISKCG